MPIPSLLVPTSTCLNYEHLCDSALPIPIPLPFPLRRTILSLALVPYLCPSLSNPRINFLSLFSFCSAAATKKDSLEEIIRNAEGLLSYLESNVETLLQDIDPKGLIQAKIDIAKAGTGAGRGRGRESGLSGGGVIGEVEEDEVKQDIRKGDTTKLIAFYVPVLSCPVLSCPLLP